VAVRVASFELVLPILEQAQRRQDLSLSALQKRFRVPPRCPSLPDPVIPQHLLATDDHRVPLAVLSGGGSGTAAAPEKAEYWNKTWGSTLLESLNKEIKRRAPQLRQSWRIVCDNFDIIFGHWTIQKGKIAFVNCRAGFAAHAIADLAAWIACFCSSLGILGL
jgi:hypothetical protein